MNMEKGVLYVVTGEQYLNEAERSAESLKNTTNIHCTLITDQCHETNIFDSVNIVSNDPDSPDKLYKIENMTKTPYEKTIFLDSDTYICRNISPLFDIIKYFDLAVSHAPIRSTHRIPELPNCFPEYNTGVICYQKNKQTQELFNKWKNNYLKSDYEQDQPSFRKSLIHNNKLRFHTLPPEYNCRSIFPGYLNESVRIIHGRHSSMRRVAKTLNEKTIPRVHYPTNIRLKIITSERGRFLGLPFRVYNSIKNRGASETIRVAKNKIINILPNNN
ncbi:hypothetical protein EXE46_14165 [Halorubrum sp. GN11_10-6_MGM]|uniref:putative nucleotide-diphospho-sugar transferase n=1 Tax=Halorubrum sp. GN11_10-6_MGM TaxID=2518112 RepID=UPI0010F95A07|nr:putative nucleotide-diphospho-sugar transferase [Halorubrum sp. GN11_10-6_MGM]TKX73486.1 hypothetical protein EXE46_14165 [Halorubrum sp. GN11_10-6_MGM]